MTGRILLLRLFSFRPRFSIPFSFHVLLYSLSTFLFYLPVSLLQRQSVSHGWPLSLFLLPLPPHLMILHIHTDFSLYLSLFPSTITLNNDKPTHHIFQVYRLTPSVFHGITSPFTTKVPSSHLKAKVSQKLLGDRTNRAVTCFSSKTRSSKNLAAQLPTLTCQLEVH